MRKTSKPRKPDRNSPYAAGEITIGRKGFAKISAVEGIVMSKSMEMVFRELDRKNASPEVRRKALARKYGK
jgi:hypothetical protein